MGSIVGHRIDYNGVGVLRGQQHTPSKNWPKYPSRDSSVFRKYEKRTTTFWSHMLNQNGSNRQYLISIAFFIIIPRASFQRKLKFVAFYPFVEKTFVFSLSGYGTDWMYCLQVDLKEGVFWISIRSCWGPTGMSAVESSVMRLVVFIISWRGGETVVRDNTAVCYSYSSTRYNWEREGINIQLNSS